MTTAVITRPTFKIGSKGQGVASIQKALQNAGFSPGRIDSDFGSKTDTAVRNFQKAHNLKVDGIVGKDTWALLQKYSTPTQVPNYTVQPGDSLWKIAQKYKISTDTLQKANPNINANNLQIGTKIVIPNARVAKPYTNNAPVSPSGNSNDEKVWNFFKAKGFLDGATAGIMGNLKQESGIDPTKKQFRGGPGRGIAQWEKGGRWDQLVRYARSQGRSEWALDTQLGFLWYELNGGDSTTKAILKRYGGIEGLKKMGIEDAVKAFQISFERAGKPDYPSRFRYAYDFYKRFAGRSGFGRAGV
ncbi:phage tail tip lysozyme [Caldalkalibacillus mannanilyticus]|uniref:phage tail tip lysozyme n=1 Tax=Caldalkalibacillus mannanilyticus TaxID=1418 RepID=UPI0004682BD1|nr:phage tail tip lysozyme [Caldalkalibacillus mannanilyticus]